MKEAYFVSGVRVERQRSEIPGGRPPIIFVHGGLHGSWTWREFQNFFSMRGHDTHALNWFSHNGSKELDQDAFLKRRLADIVEEVELVRGGLSDQPILIGHSMGGMVLQKYAERHSDIRALVLLCPTSPPAAKVPPKELGVDASRPWPAPPFEITRKMFLPDLPEVEARRVYELLTPEYPLCALEATQDQPDVDIASIRCPVLAIAAANDLVVPCDVVERLAALYRCEFHIIPNRGHDLPFEPGWQETAEIVSKWLDGKFALTLPYDRLGPS